MDRLKHKQILGSSIRRLAARCAEAAFLVAFPITLAAMALQGWTAP